MTDFDEPLLDTSEQTVRIPDRRGDGSRGPAIAIAVLVVAAVGAAGWYLLRRSTAPEQAAVSAPAATAPEAPVAAAPAPARTEPAIPLPALNASDAVVRELVARLSANPQLAKWLVNDDLVRRFVATVSNLAEGASPSSHVRFLTPASAFAVREANGRAFVDPASYRRYDLATEAFVSLDIAGTAKLYRELRPLLDEAYQELGYPGASFDEALGAAIVRLRAVQVPAQAPELVPQGAAGWAYADPKLEDLTSAEKHLLRMGPENARRAQAKLGELAAALGISSPPG
jgi:hypothetical protein